MVVHRADGAGMRLFGHHLVARLLAPAAASLVGCATYIDRMEDEPTEGVDFDGDGWTEERGDCDDADPAVHPGAEEICNGTDDDCTGVIPADEADADNDGYRICEGDCDDDAPLVHPGAEETCDSIDDDCDGLIDDNVIGAPTWYADSDNDGFGDPEVATTACSAPSGFVVDDSDCDDASASVFPGAQEDFYSGVDEDCDGWIDEVDVCWDGMADATTIQDGVDLAGDGSPVLVCPGTYEESIVLNERSVSIIGMGESKTDVLIDAGGREYVLDGRFGLSTTSYELRNLKITGSTVAAIEVGDYWLLINALEIIGLELSDIESGHGIVVWAEHWLGNDLNIHNNHTDGNLLFAWMGDSITIQSWFHDNVANMIMAGSGAISNNLFSGNISDLVLSASARMDEPAYVWPLYINNNTFADNDSQYGILSITGIRVMYDYNQGYGPFSTVDFQNNIFASNQSEYQVTLSWSWCNYSFQQIQTHLQLGYNLFWDYSGLAWNEENTNNDCEYYTWCCDCDCYTFETDELAEILLAEPTNLFDSPMLDPMGNPPYSLIVGSPALDAGNPDQAYIDTDGTRNDLGAYGGPGGDWGGGT
jgi:hypothetical protein